MTICTRDSAVIHAGAVMVSPMGIFADESIRNATSEPSPAMVLSELSIMKNAFCKVIEKKASITTPIKADTIAAPRTALEKFLNR